MVGYDATYDPTWFADSRGGPRRWLEFTFAVVALVALSNLVFVYLGTRRIEATRRRDVRTHARARLQRDQALRIVSNFLPAAVVNAMHERGDSKEVRTCGACVEQGGARLGCVWPLTALGGG